MNVSHRRHFDFGSSENDTKNERTVVIGYVVYI